MKPLDITILKCRNCGFFDLSGNFVFDEDELVNVCPNCGETNPERKERNIAYVIKERGELKGE